MLEVSRLARSAPDSARFGLEVWRASDIGAPVEVGPELIASGADVAIYRLPTVQSRAVRRLAQDGFVVVDAGVLVYYTMDLAAYAPRPPANPDLVIESTLPGDDDELSRLIDASFDGYVSHYLANPLFSADAALAGYREWALRHRLDATRTASWVARRGGRIVAFACCEFDAARGICNGGIYGVLPGQARGGLFGDLIRFTQSHFKRLGYVEMRMSTKVDNLAVQKVWCREGFHLYAVYDTLHVNALLSTTRGGMSRQPLRIDAGDTGLLLNDALAASVREMDGSLELATLSEKRLGPLAGGNYTLTVHLPDSVCTDGSRCAIAHVHDATGRLVVLGQAHLRQAQAGPG